MKKILSSAAVLIFFFNAALSIAQTNKDFSFTPEKPKAGEQITVTYNPDGSKLASATNVIMLIHTYGKNIYYSDEVALQKEGKSWKGTFAAADTCAGVVLRFTDGAEYDNNGTKCFPIRFYGADGKLAKYASAGLAVGYINWFGAFEFDPDPETALKFFQFIN